MVRWVPVRFCCAVLRNSLNYVECRRGRLFDELTAFIIYEMCMENPTATVSFNGKEAKEIGNFLITIYASLQSKILHRFLPLMDAKFDIDRSVTLVDRRKENFHLFLSTPLNCRKGPLGIFEWAQNKLWKYVLIKFDCDFYCLIVAALVPWKWCSKDVGDCFHRWRKSYIKPVS